MKLIMILALYVSTSAFADSEHLFICTAIEGGVEIKADLQREGETYFAQFELLENGNSIGTYMAKDISVFKQVGATTYATNDLSRLYSDGNYHPIMNSQFWFSYFDRDVVAGSVYINLKLEGREIETTTRECNN
jgi:hypothetical protein